MAYAIASSWRYLLLMTHRCFPHVRDDVPWTFDESSKSTFGIDLILTDPRIVNEGKGNIFFHTQKLQIVDAEVLVVRSLDVVDIAKFRSGYSGHHLRDGCVAFHGISHAEEDMFWCVSGGIPEECRIAETRIFQDEWPWTVQGGAFLFQKTFNVMQLCFVWILRFPQIMNAFLETYVRVGERWVFESSSDRTILADLFLIHIPEIISCFLKNMRKECRPRTPETGDDIPEFGILLMHHRSHPSILSTVVVCAPVHASLDHYWLSVIRPLFEVAKVKNILEIGSAAGRNTRNIIALAREKGGVVIAIDPEPQFDVFEWRMEYADCFHFMEETSLNALPKLEGQIDAVLIDGDHNWYTVFHELQLLEKHATKTGLFPLTLLHDVGWPYGRRDMYSDPDRIPASYRQPFLKKGMLPSGSELIAEGGLNATMHNALYEHSIKNGVLTAVEDFIAQSSITFDWIEIPGFFGLGILVDRKRAIHNAPLQSFLNTLLLSDPIRQHLKALESERIEVAMEAVQAVRGEDRVSRAFMDMQVQLEETVQAFDTKLAESNAEHSRLLDGVLGEKKVIERNMVAARNELERITIDASTEVAFHRFIRDAYERELQKISLQLLRMQQSKSWRLTNYLRIVEPKIRQYLTGKRPTVASSTLAPFQGIEPSKALFPTGKRMVGCTIVSKNFLAHARVLAHSFHLHHPDAEFIVLLVDDIDTVPDSTGERISMVSMHDLPLPDRNQFCFRYGLRELHTAAKPFFLEWIFHHRQVDQVVYLDPDILMEAPLLSVQKALSSHSVVLTPHVLKSIEDGLRPSDYDVLRVGVFNLGFIGLSDTAVTRDFLNWWQKRVTEDCTEQPDRNVFFDQRWMDLVPAIFSGVHVLKDPTCNVAYWNLHERFIQSTEGHYNVEGYPLTFFHFSGYSPARPDDLCKYRHSDRSFDSFPAVKPLFDRYRRLLIENGFESVSCLPYDFGNFENGVPIPACIRRHFHSLSPRERSSFQNPSLTGCGSYWEWLHSPSSGADADAGLTNAHFILWQSSPQLRESIPAFGKEYAEWLAHPDHRHLFPDIASIFLESLQEKFVPMQHSFFRSALLRRNTFRWYRAFTDVARRMLPSTVFAGIRDILSMQDVSPPAKRPSERESRPFGMTITAPFTSGNGVGQAARMNVAAADAAGIPIALRNIPGFGRRHVPTDLHHRFTHVRPYDTHLLHMNADQVSEFVREKGTRCLLEHRSIGYWVWELSRFPKRWGNVTRWFDEIWTPSSFSAAAIREQATCPVHVIPHAIQMNDTCVHRRQDFGIRDDRYVFLFMFDCESVIERKNPFAVLKAFSSAFCENDAVELVIKFSNADQDPSIRARLAKAAAGLPVVLIDSFLSLNAAHDLLRLCDAYVSLHRSEGFGLSLAEAMYCGKPVIATNYSGNTDFMNQENSIPIDYTLVPLGCDEGPYGKGNVWADPDMQQAADAMRRLYEDPLLSSRLGAKAAHDIRLKHSPEVVGALMQQRIRSSLFADDFSRIQKENAIADSSQ